MAEILNGTSGHLTFAPLSCEQAQSISKHLQDHIRKVESRVSTLEDSGLRSNDHSTGIWASLKKEASRIDRVKEELDNALNEIANNRKGLGQTNMKVQKLQTGLDQSNQNIGVLREVQRKADELLNHTVQCLGHNDKQTMRLHEMLEKQVNPDMSKLRDDLGSANFNVCRLQEGVETLKANSQMQLEHLRAVNTKAQTLEETLAKTDNRVEATQQQFMEFSKIVKDMQKALDGTKTAVAKVKEFQDRTAAQVMDLHSITRKSCVDIQKNSDDIDHTCNTLQNALVQLNKACSDIGVTRQNLHDMLANLQKLRASHDMVNDEHNQLARQVAQIEMDAKETRKGLCQTNAVVLPNLQMNSGVAINMDVPLSARISRGSQKASKFANSW